MNEIFCYRNYHKAGYSHKQCDNNEYLYDEMKNKQVPRRSEHCSVFPASLYNEWEKCESIS